MDTYDIPNLIPDQLNLRPHCFNQNISEDDINRYNNSNTVISSQTVLIDMMSKLDASNMLLVELSYNDKKVQVDIESSHIDDSNIIYVPYWIIEFFEYKDDDNVNYHKVNPTSGNRIKIKPHSEFYAYLPDPVNALRNAFEKYSVLSKDITIPLFVDEKVLYVDILDINSDEDCICIRGVELEVEIEELLPELPPELPQELPHELPHELNNLITPVEEYDTKKFPGKGYLLGS
jgi:hypothetical protein